MLKSISEINAKTIVSAAGCWTKELLEDIPVVPQKHTVFRVKCPTYIKEMPLTGDLTTGVYWRPEGGEYLAGSPLSVFDADDLEPAWNDFEELVWPALAKRIPAFEELKLTGGWAGYYDCNKLDNNAVVGKHPKYEKRLHGFWIYWKRIDASTRNWKGINRTNYNWILSNY
jgi:FAD-dependent oxidoreductase domain-containing protein 1